MLTYLRDITNRHSVLSVYSDICKTMPPVGGVANGAMVLRDSSFPRMSYDELQTVLRPKVEGTQYLDELFSTNNLDFFILFSSLMAVLGNSGQSNYSAANMFMTSLAGQRRKRGLAASVMNISGIFGIGYVSRVDDVTHKQLAKIKFKPMSEQDFHQMFAEAVLGGTPESGANAEFTAGLQQVSADQNTAWGTNPKFSHFVTNLEEVTTKKDNREAAASLKSQLLLVSTKEEATTLIEGKSYRSAQFCVR
jgi:hybrid polyketide synthase / nonribosomal peptide synthetase ACE1